MTTQSALIADAAACNRRLNILTRGEKWSDGAVERAEARAHNVRLSYLRALTEGPRDIATLDGIIGRHKATVSDDMARLHSDGFVTRVKVNRCMVYSLSHAGQEALDRADLGALGAM